MKVSIRYHEKLEEFLEKELDWLKEEFFSFTPEFTTQFSDKS